MWVSSPGSGRQLTVPAPCWPLVEVTSPGALSWSRNEESVLANGVRSSELSKTTRDPERSRFSLYREPAELIDSLSCSTSRKFRSWNDKRHPTRPSEE